MNDEAGVEKERTLTVQLEVHLDREPISGRLRTERGAEERFVGWLGLGDALRRLDERERQ